MKVIATYNLKGGVGKTSTAVNLAYVAARQGLRTLLWDLDPQGSATYLFRVKPRVKGGSRALVRGRRVLQEAIKATDFDRLDVMPADFSYRHLDLDLDAASHSTATLRRLLTPLKTDYDLVVLDCPPSVSLASESVLDAADLLVVPLVPATLSARSFEQLTTFVSTTGGRRPKVVGFLSMVDRRKKAHRELAAQLPRDWPEICAVAVPSLAAVEQMADYRSPLAVFAPRSPASAAYERLWAELAQQLNLSP